MKDLDSLITDPQMALGIGLLQAGQPGGNFSSGLGTTMGLLQHGSQQKQAQQQALLNQITLQQKLAPKHKFNPVTGEQIFTDPMTGGIISGSAPQAGGSSGLGGTPQTSGLNPKMQQELMKQQMAEEFRIEQEERAQERQIEREKRNPTESQSKAYGFAKRMKNASSVFGNDGDNVLASTGQNIVSDLPMGNHMISDAYQGAQQAQRDWVTANLRKESGAVIGKDEMEQEVKKYFPVPGDSRTTIQQKRKSRKLAEEGMINAAGTSGQSLTQSDIHLPESLPPLPHIPHEIPDISLEESFHMNRLSTPDVQTIKWDDFK